MQILPSQEWLLEALRGNSCGDSCEASLQGPALPLLPAPGPRRVLSVSLYATHAAQRTPAGTAKEPAWHVRSRSACSPTPQPPRRPRHGQAIGSKQQAGSRSSRADKAAHRNALPNPPPRLGGGQALPIPTHLHTLLCGAQDLAVAQLRQQEPIQSYCGLWPEFALLGHSCAPNTVSCARAAAAQCRRPPQAPALHASCLCGVPLPSTFGGGCRCVPQNTGYRAQHEHRTRDPLGGRARRSRPACMPPPCRPATLACRRAWPLGAACCPPASGCASARGWSCG